MQQVFKLDQFEGPLDLLLRLIEDEKLDITTISLAKVTDQYLAFIEHEEQLPADEIADFLIVAAKLIYIKSKYLLPALEVEEEDGIDLELQLKLYREYYRASKVILKMLGKKKFSYVRTVPLKLPREAGFHPPKNATPETMAEAFWAALGRIEVIIRLPKIVLKTAVSIRDKIASLRAALEKGIVSFHRFYDSSNKQDVIVSFLAMLELVKMRDIDVEQDGLFTEITIRKFNNI